MNQESDSEFVAVIAIAFPDCDMQFDCLIRHLKDDVYKVCEHPTFAEDTMRYGDSVKLLKTDDKNYEFQKVTSRSELKFVQYIINDEIASGLAELLDKVTGSNGYWQRDFGGILSLFYDDAVFDPRPDLELVLEKYNEN